MTNRLLATILLLVTFPGYGLGQTPELQPTITAMSPEELTQAVTSIQAQLKELLERVGGTNSAPVKYTSADFRTELDRVKDDLRQLSDVVAGNTQNLSAVIDQQKTMAGKLVEVSDQLSKMTKDQIEFADQIKER